MNSLWLLPAYIEVLRQGSFKKEYLAQLTGNKFLRYHGGESRSSPPASLFNLAATLLARGIITFQALLPHLEPDLKQVVKKQVRTWLPLSCIWRKANGALSGAGVKGQEVPPGTHSCSSLWMNDDSPASLLRLYFVWSSWQAAERGAALAETNKSTSMQLETKGVCTVRKRHVPGLPPQLGPPPSLSTPPLRMRQPLI